MAALVQSYSQQPSAVTMLQGRPASSGGAFSPQPSMSRNSQGPRYSPSSGSYRGLPSTGLVAPYAFTSTPQLTNNAAFLQNATPHLRPQNRTLSAPNLLGGSPQPFSGGTALSPRQRVTTSSSLSTSSSSSTSPQPSKKSLDDASITTRETSVDVPARPKSTVTLSPPGSNQSVNTLTSPKPSPDRYRKVSRPQVDIPNNFTSGRGQLSPYGSSPSSITASQSHGSLASTLYIPGNDRRISMRVASSDDLSLTRATGGSKTDLAQRYRRRSVGDFDAVGDFANNNQTLIPNQQQARKENKATLQSPVHSRSKHSHHGSSESISSSKSGKSTKYTAQKDYGPSTGVTVNGLVQATSFSKQEIKVVNVPARNENSKRAPNPSPLSKPSVVDDAAPKPTITTHATDDTTTAKPIQPRVESPAVQQLAAVNKEAKKKSRLRRAFSFSSGTELRRASAQNNLVQSQKAPIEQPSKRNSKFEDEMDPVQARIAEKQEAGGLGESIYSGQGNIFSGSTDNLSIQSSASSASIMLRKMGKGVKKSTRSIVGLFRPKSVIGVPAADGPVATPAQVSMVTVEAEREKVNVNLNPHDQVGGGTGFPKLERNSMDTGTALPLNKPSIDTTSRRSIVGGERERAEVLAAVKKGILKRTDSGQSSPVSTPKVQRAPDFNLPQIPHVNDSPCSSEPTTPSDGAPSRAGHRRTDSMTIEAGDSDYFSSITQFAALGTPEASYTPHGSMVRNISWSQRIRFHDTWPSMEYDRRGDIATCNRLTPMLAQQIKEELNTFKMEMEVHESSKVYTHFF